MSYGYVFTTDEVKKQLKELNRDYEGRKTWGNMYAQADLTGQLATSQINYDYASAMNEAYKSAYSQQSAIANSNLGTNFKREANAQIDDTLMQAFETYRQNYLSSKSQIQASVNNVNEGIDEALTEQANNIVAYQESPYDYLTDIYNRAYGLGNYEEIGEDSTLKNLFTNDITWSRYLTTDPQGNQRLKTRDELMLEMYDKDRNLTIRGAEFYDQMLNGLGTQYGEDYGFSKWLATNKEDLYNWSKSNNMYAVGSGDEYGANSNLSHVREMLGLDSTDAKYEFAERYGALSKKELENVYKPIQDKLDNLVKLRKDAAGAEWDTEEVIEQYKGIVDEIAKLAKQYGIYDYLGEQYGSWDKLKNDLEGALEGTFKGTTKWSASYEKFDLGDIEHRSALGSDIVAFFKTIGDVFTWDIGEQTKEQKKAKQDNINRAKRIEDAYANLVTSMTLESYKRQEAAQAEFYKKYK